MEGSTTLIAQNVQRTVSSGNVFVVAQLAAPWLHNKSPTENVGKQPKSEAHAKGEKLLRAAMAVANRVWASLLAENGSQTISNCLTSPAPLPSQIQALASPRHATPRAPSESWCSRASDARGSSAAPQKAAGPDRSKSKCQ